MTIADYAKKAFNDMKEKSPKERWAYFLDYYKWHAIVALAVIALLVQGIVTMCNHRDTVFSGVLFNTVSGTEMSAFLDDFSDYAQIDTQKNKAEFSTKLYLDKENNQSNTDSFQRVMASIAVKELDFIVGPPEAFHRCAYTAGLIFADLREHLDEASLAKFSDRLYYIDGAVLEQLRTELGDKIHYNSIVFPDPRKPETMKDPIPVGIDISDREAFKTAYYLPDTVLYMGIVTNSTRPEMALTFLDYLFYE